MEFRKERNFIVVYNGVVKMGAWNISDGSFIGKSGKPVKTIPSCFTYKNLPDRYDRRFADATLLGHVVRRFREWQSLYDFQYNNTRGNRLEQLISVGLLPNDINDLDNTTSLTKDLVAYIKENNRGLFDNRTVNNFLAEKKYSEFLKGKPEWAKEAFRRLISNLPYDYLKTIINRAIHEHLDSFYDYYHADEIANLIRNYYKICMTLYGSVEIKPNILSNYAHLCYLEKEYKDAHYNEHLNAHNNKQWLHFEDETFLVRPLLTKDEFHEEAERQNNCVERLYMERVYNAQTHVVVVRRKSDPDKNYITCEVNNNGKIIQYLKKNNSRNIEADAIQFKNLYQNYLQTVTKD